MKVLFIDENMRRVAAVLKIQHVWFNYIYFKFLKAQYADFYYNDESRCRGPYSEDLSRCFGSCCN